MGDMSAETLLYGLYGVILIATVIILKMPKKK